MSEEITESFFTFGEPEEVHHANMLDYLNVFADLGGEYYIPPIDLSGLSLMRRANGHHGSCVIFRSKTTANAYISGPLPVQEFSSAVTDLLTFGNAYFQVLRNVFGNPTGLAHIPALNMRVKTKNSGYRLLKANGEHTDFAADNVIHIKEYDTQQQIYGVPDWIGGLQSALLNQDATLFRRKYYVNGAHLGYILYTNDAKMDPKLVKALQQKVREGKGVGNFKSLHVHIPKGEEKAFQIIPIGDISQKDEFKNIKDISASDVREAHRVPPILMGVIPANNGSLGDPIKIKQVYDELEVQSMTRAFEVVNRRLPKQLHLKFKKYNNMEHENS
jgi:PBSX family phage portal protein